MVSADSPKQALKYQAMGAKTFRVAMQDDYLFDNEIECLADSKGIQCIDCGLCDGKSANVAIAVHGSLASRFKTSLIQTVTI
jgi:serine/threonine-protein kinase RIO1